MYGQEFPIKMQMKCFEAKWLIINIEREKKWVRKTFDGRLQIQTAAVGTEQPTADRNQKTSGEALEPWPVSGRHTYKFVHDVMTLRSIPGLNYTMWLDLQGCLFFHFCTDCLEKICQEPLWSFQVVNHQPENAAHQKHKILPSMFL